jgi:hypothetical protein
MPLSIFSEADSAGGKLAGYLQVAGLDSQDNFEIDARGPSHFVRA